MPTAKHRPPGLRVQADRRRVIEAGRLWASPLQWPSPPDVGWLAGVRIASGLSMRDVAGRLGVSQPAVLAVESSERSGTVGIDVLRRYAEAMDADVHYVIVPRASVMSMVDSRGQRRRHLLRLRPPSRKPRLFIPPPVRVIDKPEVIDHPDAAGDLGVTLFESSAQTGRRAAETAVAASG